MEITVSQPTDFFLYFWQNCIILVKINLHTSTQRILFLWNISSSLKKSPLHSSLGIMLVMSKLFIAKMCPCNFNRASLRWHKVTHHITKEEKEIVMQHFITWRFGRNKKGEGWGRKERREKEKKEREVGESTLERERVYFQQPIAIFQIFISYEHSFPVHIRGTSLSRSVMPCTSWQMITSYLFHMD